MLPRAERVLDAPLTIPGSCGILGFSEETLLLARGRSEVLFRLLQQTRHASLQDLVAGQPQNVRDVVLVAPSHESPAAKSTIGADGDLDLRPTPHYIQMLVPKDLPGIGPWVGIATIGIAMLMCVRDDKETIDCRYFISSSLKMGVKQFAHAERSHWAIENSGHWSLDITYREDKSRVGWNDEFLLETLTGATV